MNLSEYKCNLALPFWKQWSRNVRNRTCGNVRPANMQISLRIRSVWSDYSLDVFWIAKDAKFLHTVREGSDQTTQMRRLFWVFVRRTCPEVCFLPLRFKYCYFDTEDSMKYIYSQIPSILYKSILGRYRPVRVADGPITARYRFIKNASWVCRKDSLC